MLPVPYPPPPPSIDSAAPSISDGGDGHSGGPSLLIIAGIIAFVIAASAAIHLLLRLVSRYRSSSSSTSSSSPPSPTPLLQNLPSAATSVGGGGGGAAPPSDRDQLIASLPLFSIASSVAAAPKSSSLDCAVCLSAFRLHDELRLLPACRHAFHSQCVDTWLRSTPSCPLCRSSIHLPPPPPPPPPQPLESVNLGHSRSGSFRVELGSVSRRRLSAEGIPAAAGGGAAHGRSYSLGSSFEYLVEEEVEAVLERLRKEKPDNGAVRGVPAAPGAEVAEVAGGSGRGWLRDCVDRLASSASSSFNSLRFSSRFGSRRFESASAGGAGGGGRSWDLEENSFVQWEEESEFGMFYRWLVGV